MSWILHFVHNSFSEYYKKVSVIIKTYISRREDDTGFDIQLFCQENIYYRMIYEFIVNCIHVGTQCLLSLLREK